MSRLLPPHQRFNSTSADRSGAHAASLRMRVFALAASFVPLLVPPVATAAPPLADPTPSELVQQALAEEIDGSVTLRAELLNQALQRDPDFAPGRWCRGELEWDNQWVRFDTVPRLEEAKPDVAAYRELRAGTAHTDQDQLKLANWCRRHDLLRRERAHLTAALEASGDPNDPVLRERLGFERINGQWVTRQELENTQKTARLFRDGFRRWQPKLKLIARQLDSPQLDVQQRAVEQLKAIQDPVALPALEAVFSSRNLSQARLLVEAMDGMTTHWAGVFLARQAVLSPFKTVRSEAAEALRARQPEEYAPSLLEALHTTIASRVDLYVGQSGVRLSHVLFQENQAYEQLALLESSTRFIYYVSPLGRGRKVRQLNVNQQRRGAEEAVLDARLQAYARQRTVAMKNDVTRELNKAIGAVLSTATGIDLPPDPEKWWEWWLDYNQLCKDDEKPRQYLRAHQELIQPMPIANPPMSCLRAGTPVWTDRGAVPVEEVQVGDLALARDSETGELAYKPVLRTTVRPPTELWNVHTEHDTFEATGGHTFWISGQGWLKLRDAQPGMRFHGATGPVRIEAIAQSRTEPAYNLVVADFHTYFVGASRILSHDPTFAQPTDLSVPGLTETRPVSP